MPFVHLCLLQGYLGSSELTKPLQSHFLLTADHSKLHMHEMTLVTRHARFAVP